MFGRIWPKWSASSRTPSDPVRSGRIPAILARSGRISGRFRPDLAGSRPFWSDPAGSGQIRPDSCQIRPASDHGRIPASFGRNLVRRHPAMEAGSCRSPASSVFRPDVAEIRHHLDSDDRLLLDSDNGISNMRVRTKSLISENDLRFLKP
jgi:hypothetical protein